MSTDSTATAAPPSTARSAVANGSRYSSIGVDGRSAEARRFRDVLADLVDHLGGVEWASEPQKHLARRAAALIVSCERAEVALAKGGEFDVANTPRQRTRLRRLLADLGLERKARDVTPTLDKAAKGKAAYLAGKVATA
jgi:hypothetical protein